MIKFGKAVLGEIELNLSKANFTTWFKKHVYFFFWREESGNLRT